ncbi:trimeric intracellular cation channel family protein [Cognatiluteimonas weifangensis]|uniref:Trimeric intracellular cation channel family protein n=1 Tax=Cognatiluteimonas weifangensis TaxID=2303539 RepID=A0A372DN65_9GAMM|nr:trimeric intracellular cation channel family protein [Luteimonas weifangensis]RFP60944.1 trimeric intracellular cation channel family protein [Luteimonas weifangensis]
MHTFLIALDLVGTFVFAISGATLGVRKRMDLFGVLVLAFAAAVSGGIARDVLIGAIPPVALVNWHYLGVSCLAGLLVFFRYHDVERLRNPVQVFDAVGLALFAVTGTTKALAAGLGPMGAVLLGMLTGIGGGMVRDILAARIPVVLQSELYAVAALAGAALVVLGRSLHLPGAPTLLAGALLCFGLRYLAIRRGWRLPVAQSRRN